MNLEILKTDRLILRRFSPNDLKYIFENYPEQEIREILGHNSDEAFLKEKNRYEKGYSTYNRSFEYFQIIDKASMHIIGECGFHNWYFEHKRAELGYAITNENFKGIGMMSETLKTIIDYGFNNMKLHRIESLVGSENIPSLKLMTKFNFNKEGVMKQHYYINDKFEDSVLFAKLAEE